MTDKEIQKKLAIVRQSYLASLVDKREAIRNLLNSLMQEWTQESFQELYIIIHGLAGSAETFGLPELTQSARNIVNQLREFEDQQIDLTEQHGIAEDINALLKQMESISLS